jgi:Na+-driven multidrug efflux pump
MAIMMVGFSMGTAASVLIGQNMGASLPDRAMKSGWRTLKYYEFIVAPVALIFLVFPYQIVGIFNNDAQVLKVGAEFLRFIAVTLPFLASGLILARGIMGAGDTVAPAVIAGVNQLALRIAVAYGLVYIFGMGTNGIWLGVNASDILQGLIMIWYFRKGFWKKRYHAHRSVLEQGLIAV